MLLWACQGRSPAAYALLVVLLTGSVSPIGVNRIGAQEANSSLSASVLTTGKVGTEAHQFLSQLDLGQADDSERLFVLAELSFAYARRTYNRSYFLAAAAYSWQFLFSGEC